MRKIIFIVMIFVLTGCAPREALQARANVVELEPDSRSAEQRAEELSGHITQLEGIDKASVVITGNSAIVGMGLTSELDDRELMRLKTKVEKEVKRLDPALSHVAVTASGELVERINDLADSVVSEKEPPKLDPELERVVENLTPPV